MSKASRWHFRAFAIGTDGPMLDIEVNLDSFTDHPEAWVVMQSTGLTDKKGVEIFEGDVIDWDNEHLGQREEVRWCTTELAWICHNPKDNGSWLCGVAECATVIGNIHENPELLEAT